MRVSGLQRILDTYPPDTPIAFSDPDCDEAVPGGDLLPEHLVRGVENNDEMLIIPEGSLHRSQEFLLIKAPRVASPFAF